MTLPPEFERAFCIAKPSDIRSWSFGELTSPRHSSADFHANVEGTLHDQRIFGPVRDFHCACGKYSGENLANLVCDRCGVKVTHRSVRSSRFGHIEFAAVVPHPFDRTTMMACFPVVPAQFMQSTSGQRLLVFYDQLVEANLNGDELGILTNVNRIIELLTPVVVMLHSWALIRSRDILARGMALGTLG